MQPFTFAAFINEPEFSARLATTCDNQGYGLQFPEKIEDIENAHCVLIDLNDKQLSPFKLGKSLQSSSITTFGLVNRLNNTLQKKANESGFNLVFPKSLFCNNLNAIVKQVQNAR